MPTRINSTMPTYIGNYSMSALIEEIDSVSDKEKSMDWFSYGGSVLAGWKLANYLNTTDSSITAIVTGMAASMGAALLPYFSKVEGSKQSFVMLHAPAGGGEKMLEKVAKDLEEALAAKINDKKLKEITGVTLSEMMAQRGDDRKDYWLTGEQAYAIGLFDVLIDTAPKQTIVKQELQSAANKLGYSLPAAFLDTTPTAGANQDAGKIINKDSKMDSVEFKAKHPAVYAQVFAEGSANGIKIEKDRVEAYLVFNDVDPEAVKTGIASGEAMNTATQMDLLRKSMSKDALKDIEDGQGEDTTEAAIDTGKNKEGAELEAALEENNIGTSK